MFHLILCVILMAATHAEYVKPPLYPHGPMFGGKSIDIEQVPYVVTLFERSSDGEYIRNGAPLCSGILISKKYVLTVAHCTLQFIHTWTGPIARVNSNFFNVNVTTEYRVEKYKMHENFSVNKYGVPVNDLALLKIKFPDNLNNIEPELMPEVAFQSALLFNDSEDLSPGVDALITGWAKFNGSNDEHLTSRIVSILDLSLCEKAYDSIGGISAGQICAAYPGANGKDGCQGHSGAPLVIEGRVAGLLSWGNGCIKPHYPGLYTKLAYYRGWIDDTMKHL